MRIEVSVPGIRKARGKLPAPTTLAAPRLGLSLPAGPLICAELAGPALREPGDWRKGWRVCRHRAPGQCRNDQEYDHPPPPASRQQQPAALFRGQTAARCSVPADCVA
jgi:hypothetical protein